MSKELETFRQIIKGFTETFNMAICISRSNCN